jgi:hypothetical protein
MWSNVVMLARAEERLLMSIFIEKAYPGRK